MRRLLFTAVLLVAALFLLPVLWPQDISHESAEGAAETPPSDGAWREEALRLRAEGAPVKRIAEELASRFGMPKNKIKSWLLEPHS